MVVKHVKVSIFVCYSNSDLITKPFLLAKGEHPDDKATGMYFPKRNQELRMVANLLKTEIDVSIDGLVICNYVLIFYLLLALFRQK